MTPIISYGHILLGLVWFGLVWFGLGWFGLGLKKNYGLREILVEPRVNIII